MIIEHTSSWQCSTITRCASILKFLAKFDNARFLVMHWQDEAGQYDEFAAREMTFAAVRKLCRERGSYSVPSSNTILYLHQNKFRNIAGLEKFTACKVAALPTK